MKKVLSLLLAVMMVVSLCPITALADGEPLELQPFAEQEEQLDEQEEVAAPLGETADESAERTLSAGDFTIHYKASADGTVTEAGTNTYNYGTGKVYDVVLPYGAAVTSVTVSEGSSYAQKLIYTAASSSAVTINDENVSAEDKYFKEAELLLADAVSSLVSSITWNESAFATDNMKGFVVEGRSFYPVKGSTIAFVRMPRTEQSGEQPTKPSTGKNNGIFTVQLEDGTEVYPEELAKPESITWGSTTYPKDITYYEDGIWKITVPAGTSKLKFSVDNLKNLAGVENKTDYTFFATWRGSLQGGVSGGKATRLQIDPDYLGAEDMNEYGITTLPDYKDYCYETEYKDGFYTIPLEQLMRDPADMKDVEKQVWGELDSRYKYAVVFIGTHDKGRPVNGYDTMVLVQIGGEQDEGENTPPVRRSDVAASKLVSVDEKLQYTVDLSDVFYDADGDALTYKVRLGTDGEYVPFEGSTYTHTLTDWSGETLYFTANDGKTDGGSYIVKLSVPRDVLIAVCEAIVADPSDYWTENDTWNGEVYVYEGCYTRFTRCLGEYKRPNTSESYYKNNLIEAYKKLMPKSLVNASSLYEESVRSRVKDTSIYTDVSVPPYLEALAAVDALYAEGAIGSKPYTEERQAEIDRVAAACREARENLVLKDRYKKAFEYYQKNKDEAEKLLELYDPAKYTESDYTAESWQAFVGAWNDLKADVDFVFDEESGSPREYQMLQNFEKHMKALPQKFSELVSAVDITVSFKYIENMHFRYEVKTAGTDGYYNAAMTLKAGETTVMDAVNSSGRTLYTFTSVMAQVKEGSTKRDAALDSQPLYALFVNNVYVATGYMGAIMPLQI